MKALLALEGPSQVWKGQCWASEGPIPGSKGTVQDLRGPFEKNSGRLTTSCNLLERSPLEQGVLQWLILPLRQNFSCTSGRNINICIHFILKGQGHVISPGDQHRLVHIGQRVLTWETYCGHPSFVPLVYEKQSPKFVFDLIWPRMTRTRGQTAYGYQKWYDKRRSWGI